MATIFEAHPMKSLFMNSLFFSLDKHTHFGTLFCGIHENFSDKHEINDCCVDGVFYPSV